MLRVSRKRDTRHAHQGCCNKGTLQDNSCVVEAPVRPFGLSADAHPSYPSCSAGCSDASLGRTTLFPGNPAELGGQRLDRRGSGLGLFLITYAGFIRSSRRLCAESSAVRQADATVASARVVSDSTARTASSW